MRYRALLALPFAAVVLFVLAFTTAGDAAHASIVHIDVELAKLVAFAGCAGAAMRFGRGDYLRRAWSLNAACYLLILVEDVALRPGFGVFAAATWAPVASPAVVLVANACQLAGTVMLARVWRVAGFELAGSSLVRTAVRVAAVAIALVAGGWLLWTSVREVAHGQTSSLVDLVSTAADIVSFALIAPFLLTAIAFRGGSLGWTWGLYTASLFGWLLFDATLSYVPFIASATTTTLVSEVCRLMACTFGMSAGLAQRLAVAGVPSPSALEVEEHAA